MKKFVIIVLLIALLGISFQPLTLSIKSFAANEENPSYKRGKEDGQRAANEDTEVLWSVVDFAYGFTLGPIAVVHSLISRYVLGPELPEERRAQIANHQRDYREGFKDGYLHIKERNSLIFRSTGWLGWVGTWAVLDQMKQ